MTLLVVATIAVAAWLWFRGRTPERPAAAVAAASAASSAAPAPLSASQVQRGIERARQDVQRDPKDAAAWAMLAHTHEMAGQFDAAAEAYRKLLALRPDDAQAHADFADALGVAQKGSLQGEPAQLIARALKLEPTNFKALLLGGKAAFERRRYDEAIALWERALPGAPGEAMKRTLATSIAEARALQAPASAQAASAPQPFVTGRVLLAPALQGRFGADDLLFVFARPADGSRMPVALLKKRVRDLPLDFALDDTLAMSAGARLSQHERVVVGARISRRGDAIPASGDAEGELAPVPLGSAGLVVEIARVRP